MRKLLLMTSALGALFAGGSGAVAQTAPSDQPVVLDDVIVTAQRRAETAQDISISIQVLSAEQVQSVSQATDLNSLVPGAQISTAGGPVQAYIRGAGTPISNGRDQGAVSFNLDGFNLARGTQISQQFFDVARVEVLKGPQGTLYGRNSTGGAVNIITNTPELGRLGGSIGLEVGDYNLRRFNAALNIPLSDTFALRAAGQFTDRDGYLSDGADDDETQSARIRALWQPSDAVSLLVNLDLSHQGGTGGGFAIINDVRSGKPSDPWTGSGDPRFPAAGPATPGSTTSGPAYLDNDLWGASAELNWDLGFATLTVMPGYRHQQLDYLTKPGFSFRDTEENEQTSFEARLGDQSDRLTWVAGFYYFNEDQVFRLDADQVTTHSILNIDQSTQQKAVFAEATYSVTDAFRLILGARYTEEQLDGKGFVDDLTLANRDYRLFADISSNATTWRGGFEWDVTPDSMAFFTVSRGFKGGGWFPEFSGGASGTLTFRPEWMTAYTLGLRNEFFGRTLRFNVEGFYWDYKDHQEAYLGANTLGTPSFLYANAAESTIYGVSVETQWRPTSADTVRFAAEYANSEYKDFKRNVVDILAPRGSACRLSPDPSPAPFNILSLDCTGLQMQRAPEWTFSAGYDRRFPLPGGAELVAGVDALYRDERYLSIGFTPLERAEAGTVVNADLTYVASGGDWSVTLWGQNLGEEAQYTGGNSLADVVGTINPPRSYGVRLRANF